MHLISSGYAFTSTTTTSAISNNRRSTLYSSVETSESSSTSPPPPPTSKPNNKPNWEVKQHLYGLDMIKEKESGNTAASVTMDADGSVSDGEALPLPQTYITCGNCKSLFAIDEADLGDRGKGW